MSEQRVHDRGFTRDIARVDGKIQHEECQVERFVMYGAYQFKKNHKRINRNFHPPVPILHEAREQYYKRMFRLKIGGKWYSPNRSKYEFFNKRQIAELLLDFKVFSFHQNEGAIM